MLRLVSQLPRESRTVRAALGEEADWTLTTQLLAGLIDETRVTNWLVANQYAKEHERSPLPKPIPRPGVTAKPDTDSLSPAALRDFYERHKTTT